jgi:transforming growth factor-beta-induced protein
MTNTFKRSLAIVPALILALSSPVFAGEGMGYGSKNEVALTDIVDTAVGAGSFTTLVTALKAAGLVDTLKGEGPFTVFAPTDAAFAKLPEGTVEDLLKPESKEKLTAILTYHVVAGKVLAKDVVNLTSAKTVNGKELTVNAGAEGVKVDNANVTKTDITTSNGVIHVIDTVVLP